MPWNLALKDNEVLTHDATATYSVYEMSTGGVPIETENKSVVAYGWGSGWGMGVTPMGIPVRVSF